MQIRVKNTPPGEAPEHVRRAWVGLVFPVPDRFAASHKFPIIGVLSGPKTFFGTIIGFFCGQVKLETGYAVAADAAVEILSRNAPEAADWWRKNAARTIKPGKYFVFARDACEVIFDDAA
jgi:hypothetical protein